MSLCDNNESPCLVAIGDFNLPELVWSDDQLAPTNTGSRADHNIFCELMADNFFQQFFPGPMHSVGNKLDLLLTNWPEIIDHVSTFHLREGLFPSDHYAVEFMIMLKFKRAMGVKRQVYDFKNGNLMILGTLFLEFPSRLLYQLTSTNFGITGRPCFYPP